jgi:hypothetical protein
MRLLILLLAALVLTGCGAGGGTGGSVSFTMTTLKAPNGGEAFVNDAGVVFAWHTMLGVDGTTTDLSNFSPPVVSVLAVGGSGYFVGISDSNPYPNPCVWSINGSGLSLKTTGCPPESLYSPRAVNSSGITVGNVTHNASEDHPARSEASGRVTELRIPDGFEQGIAYDINDQGIAVGFVCTSPSATPYRRAAAVWDQQGRVNLLDSTDWSTASRVNNHGEIAGMDGSQIVIWGLDGRVLRRIGTPRGDEGVVIEDMNDGGELIGWVESGSSVEAVVWTASGQRISLCRSDYDDRIRPTSINNAGLIVGAALKPGDGPWPTVIWNPR